MGKADNYRTLAPANDVAIKFKDSQEKHRYLMGYGSGKSRFERIKALLNWDLLSASTQTGVG